MSRRTPFTKIEFVEERHPKQSPETPCVKMNTVLINGQPVLVEKDSITINPGDATETATVELTLLVDEVSIRQVPNGYTEGKTSTSTGPHLHFSGNVFSSSEEEFAERMAEHKKRSDRFPYTGVDVEDGKGTPITTKIKQQRDHLGRFTKRKTHYSDYLTDD